ncbi:MAG: RNA-binding protein [Candidatus Marinimicrobia bacterium]|nr:RNA-binding protein [Candidatus Neomarinimicrobiota bacterium]
MNIYVGNLNYQVTDNQLRSAFENYGEVSSAEVTTDRNSGSSKGFGFVKMPSREEGEAAVKALLGKEISGRPMVVSEAQSKK